MHTTHRKLLLMRHAKSSWDNAHLSDHDRPLARRGLEAAPEMGLWLAGNGPMPELILCSTAVRTVETTRLMLEALPSPPPVRYVGGLYHASTASLMTIVGETDSDVGCLMVVGHNPGLQDLLNHYSDKQVDVPTATIACLECDSVDWKGFFKSNPQLVFKVTPKHIDY
jgi:phosphohistidine phosphatase